MVFGYVITSNLVVVVGIFTFLLLVFQVLEGKRVIRFKGRTHMKVHRGSGYLLVGIAAFHGFLALVRINAWAIG